MLSAEGIIFPLCNYAVEVGIKPMILVVKLTNVRSFPNIKFDFDRSVTFGVQTGRQDNCFGIGRSFWLWPAFRRCQPIHGDQRRRGGGATGSRIYSRRAQGKNCRGDYQKKKIVKIENQKISNSALIGHERAVLFNPETVGLVGGSPDVRRREIDMMAQTDRKYVKRC